MYLYYIRSSNINENQKVLKILEDNLFLSNKGRKSHKELLNHVVTLKKSGKIRKNNNEEITEEVEYINGNILDDIDNQDNIINDDEEEFIDNMDDEEDEDLNVIQYMDSEESEDEDLIQYVDSEESEDNNDKNSIEDEEEEEELLINNSNYLS